MPHFELERLVDYANGLVPEAERGDLERHLAACGACRRSAEQFSLLARVSLPEEPPHEVAQRARDLFRSRAVEAAPRSRPFEVVRLLFDAGVGQMAFGTRRRGASARRQLLEAGGMLLDIDVTAAGPGLTRVVGQLSSPAAPPEVTATTRVQLLRPDGRVCGEVLTDQMGQFQLETASMPGMKLAVDRGRDTDPLVVELPPTPEE
jgi:anti-sigma factor RsiW